MMMIEKKEFITIMSLISIYKIIAFLFLIFSFSCSSSIESNLKEYCNRQNITFEDNMIIMVIAENTCIRCNREFSIFSEKYINHPNIDIILTAEGGLFNTSLYEKANNVQYDFKGRIHKKQIINSSGVIFVKNKTIDTIINIEASRLYKSFNFIENRLNELK